VMRKQLRASGGRRPAGRDGQLKTGFAMDGPSGHQAFLEKRRRFDG
jgi:hypothetical protein